MFVTRPRCVEARAVPSGKSEIKNATADLPGNYVIKKSKFQALRAS
jgi:hypothetical protein